MVLNKEEIHGYMDIDNIHALGLEDGDNNLLAQLNAHQGRLPPQGRVQFPVQVANMQNLIRVLKYL